MDDYLAVNAANWAARADAHTGPGGYRLDVVEDPAWISSVVRFDRPRLEDVRGLDGTVAQVVAGAMVGAGVAAAVLVTTSPLWLP